MTVRQPPSDERAIRVEALGRDAVRTLDLSDVVGSHDHLEIAIEVDLDRIQPDPWLADTPPTVILQIDKMPILVE